MKLSFAKESIALSLMLCTIQTAALPRQHQLDEAISNTARSNDGLTIQTASGLATGFVNSSYPDVRQFLGIPYAKSPTGALRFEPPEALKTNFGVQIQANSTPKACTQIAASSGSVFPAEFFNQAPWDEDCLTLSVWVPKTNESSKLPVVIWIHGLGLQQGSSSIESQEHIVVAVQYRLNIFGFPNGAGLNRTNLGLLDQRMGIEWVRDNIAAFGGDPNKMILWGQSSGAGAVDAQNFAFPKDPIVQGFISDSGSALFPPGTGLITYDPTHSNFSTVARGLGCPSDAAAEAFCMRSKPATDIIDFLTNYARNMTTSPLNFVATPDDIIAFSNYTDRYAKGLLSDKSSIFGSNANEGVVQVPVPKDPAHMGPNQTLADKATLGIFQCPAYASALNRASAQRKTYLYLYAGNFTDLSPLFWEGAYHMSELPQVFGTRGLYNSTASSFEVETSNAMQDPWLAFAKDPGGAEASGWAEFGSDKLGLFGTQDHAVQTIKVAG
ncbi:carboxylesterase, type B [Pestalotiopsis sp. NC0098]|nr:carboxylesterase, type B [Pestalotiopsis sp. NC0098]